MSQRMRCLDGHLVFPIGPKKYRTLKSCFLSSLVESRSVVLEEKSKMWKVNDGRTTRNHNRALEPLAQVTKKIETGSRRKKRTSEN